MVLDGLATATAAKTGPTSKGVTGNQASATKDASGTTTSGSTAAGDKQKLDDTLNRFLSLLITQLQHQDPLQPMDPNQFTEQLVQFASVEQQIKQNANLETLVGLQRGAQLSTLAGYVGTSVEVKGNTLALTGGRADGSYTLSEASAETQVTIRDGSGRTVYSGKGDTRAGRHGLAWDGRDSAGALQPDGGYTVEVTAKRKDGTAIPVTTTTVGRVTGAGVDNGETRLWLGNAQVALADVLSVQETASAKSQ